MNLLRKWKKWLVRIVGGIVLLLCVVPPSAVVSIRYQGATEVERIKAKNAVEDPNWEMDDLAREFNATLPPDEKNSFLVVEKADALLPATYEAQISEVMRLSRHAAFYVKPDAELDIQDKFIQSCEPALQLALQLTEATEGGAALKIPRDPMHTDTAVTKDHLRIAAVLEHAATNHTMHNRPDPAVQACRAILGVSRSIGSEPTVPTQIVRMTIDNLTVTTIERMLTLCEPNHGLAELQAELLRQSQLPYLKWSMRSLRAYHHRFFELTHTADFQITVDKLSALGMKAGLSTRSALYVYSQSDHAYALNKLNDYVAASQLPVGEQFQAVERISPPPFGDRRHILSAALFQGLQTVMESVFRTQGKLAAASVAIACERYRHQFGQWPESLEAIPKDILPEIPIDPCTGKLIQYERKADHIIITSRPRESNSNGVTNSGRRSSSYYYGYQIQVYDPAKRRQPAPPEPVRPVINFLGLPNP